MPIFSMEIKQCDTILDIPVAQLSPYLANKAVEAFNTPFDIKKIKLYKEKQFDTDLVKAQKGQISVLAVALAIDMPISTHNSSLSDSELLQPITEIYIVMEDNGQKHKQRVPIIEPIQTSSTMPNPVSIWTNKGIENYSIEFCRIAKNGGYNSLTDEEYYVKLDECLFNSSLFNDLPTERLLAISARHAQMITRFSTTVPDRKNIPVSIQTIHRETQPIQISIEFINGKKSKTIPLIIDDDTYTIVPDLTTRTVDISKLQNTDSKLYKQCMKQLKKKHRKSINIIALSLLTELYATIGTYYTFTDQPSKVFEKGALFTEDGKCNLIITDENGKETKHAISDNSCMFLDKDQEKIMTKLCVVGTSKSIYILNPAYYDFREDNVLMKYTAMLMGECNKLQFSSLVMRHAKMIDMSNEFISTDEELVDAYKVNNAPANADKSSNVTRRSSIKKFLDTVSFNDFYKLITKHIFGQDEHLKRACFYVYRWLEYIANGSRKIDRHGNHFIITGQSGCGKTEFARAVIRVLSEHNVKIPMVIINAGNITPSGWKGMDAAQAVRGIFDDDSRGRGIVVLDEIDKMMARRDWQGDKSTTAYLSMLDGDLIQFENDKSSAATTCSAANLLIIGTGSFSALRGKREDCESDIGFTSSTADKDAAYAKEITADDITDAYGEPEFIGRFTDVINFNKITNKTLLGIIRNTVTNYILNNPDLFDMEREDIDQMRPIEFSTKARKQLYEKAETKRGVRAAINLMKKALADTIIKYQLTHKSSIGKLDGIVINNLETADIKFIKRKTTTIKKKTDDEIFN